MTTPLLTLREMRDVREAFGVSLLNPEQLASHQEEAMVGTAWAIIRRTRPDYAAAEAWEEPLEVLAAAITAAVEVAADPLDSSTPATSGPSSP